MRRSWSSSSSRGTTDVWNPKGKCHPLPTGLGVESKSLKLESGLFRWSLTASSYLYILINLDFQTHLPWLLKSQPPMIFHHETSNSSSLQVEVVATAARRVGRSQQDLQRHRCPADAAEEFQGFVPGLRPCAAWIWAIDEENTENTIEKY